MKFLNDDPNNGKVRAIWSEALFTLGHYNGAAAESKMALQDDPGNITALKTVVQAYSRTNRVKEAQQVLDRAASLLKDDRDLEKLRRDLAAQQTMAAGFDAASQDGFRSALKNADMADDLAKRSKLVQTDADFLALVQDIESQMTDAPTDPKYPGRSATSTSRRRRTIQRPATGTRRRRCWPPRTPCSRTRSTTAT